ncbi:MAG TPA: prepilin-type N-terminal cleavage/methylation domain-containing protein [Pyrinomonadaceae bacterium]|nr:prepilin-type N-terminal cleavage/methylation domain-containing protein [Pyrinomonadaceae bacterium]
MRLKLGARRQSETRPATGGERGFTLVETVAALLILMIAGLGAASLFTYGIKNNAGTKDRELALAVAQKRMEWLRSVPYSATNRGLAYNYPTTANPVGGGLAATAAGGVTETATSADRIYTVNTVISNDGGLTDANSVSKTITVTVTPVGSSAVVGRVTLVARRAALTTGSN